MRSSRKEGKRRAHAPDKNSKEHQKGGRQVPARGPAGSSTEIKEKGSENEELEKRKGKRRAHAPDKKGKRRARIPIFFLYMRGYVYRVR